MKKLMTHLSFVVATAALLLAACKGKSESGEPSASTTGTPSGEGSIIAIDGSSTVYPITEAVAEEFRSTSPAKVTIGVSCTGCCFKKF